jgi:ribosomal-protein-alanine N-acetyltransferase
MLKSQSIPPWKKVFTRPGPFAYHAAHMGDNLNDITICPMSEADLDQVLAIENRSFPSPWSGQHFRDELSSPHSFPLSAFAASGRLVGYICPMLVLDEGHILDVAVDPDFRGHGVGRLLVERVLADCRDNGASFVSLEVRPSNLSAIALYEAIGFVECGRRKRYYQDGEDALLLEFIFGDN